MIFCSKVVRVSLLPWWREIPDCHVFVRVVRLVVKNWQVDYRIWLRFWLESYLCFYRVWMKLMEVACKKIVPVSGSLWSNLEFFVMMLLAPRLCGWKIIVNGILSFFSFCDVCSADTSLSAVSARIDNIVGIATRFKELAHLIRFVGKARVIVAQTSKCKKLKIRNGVFHVRWVTR